MSTTDPDTFRALEAAADANAAAIAKVFAKIAAGDLSPETDAAADALFWEGEAIAAQLVACEAARATAGLCAA